MEQAKTIPVEYPKPKLKQRVGAVLIDGLCLILSTLMLFSLLFLATTHLPIYTGAQGDLDRIRLDSGLYVRSGNDVELVSDHYDPENDPSLSSGMAYDEISDALNFFFADETFFAPGAGTEFFNGEKAKEPGLFYRVEGKESTDPDQYQPLSTASNDSLLDFFVDSCEKAIGFLSNDPEYSKASRTITWSTIVTVVIAYVIAYALLFVMVPYICRRGYTTMGMLTMKYARVYVDGLIPTGSRFAVRSLVAFILEGVGFLAVLIPIAVSATLVIQGKFGQSLPDYLINIYPVDTSETSVYFTPREYAHALSSGAAISSDELTPEQKEDRRRAETDRASDEL